MKAMKRAAVISFAVGMGTMLASSCSGGSENNGGSVARDQQPVAAAPVADSIEEYAEAQRKRSQCLRDHGYPEMPDPDEYGLIDPADLVRVFDGKLVGRQEGPDSGELHRLATACGMAPVIPEAVQREAASRGWGKLDGS